MKLSENEKRTLKELLRDGSQSNVAIAKTLDLTSAAIGKIRRKLEKNDVISGYTIHIDFEKIGLNTLAVVLMKFKTNSWVEPSAHRIFDRFASQPNILKIYRIPEGDTTHIVIFGFRNLNEHDRYFHVLQTQYPEVLEIKKIFTFSNKSILKDTARTLLKKIINEWGAERMPEPPPVLREEAYGAD